MLKTKRLKLNKNILIILSVLFCEFVFLNSAQAGVDVYTVFDVGSVLMKESSSGNSYTHQSSFFVGHWGYSIGVRPQLQLGQVGLGVLGELSWIGDSLERKLNGVSNSTTYRNEFHRTLTGAVLSLNNGSSSVLFEYYPWAQNTVIYSDQKTENPFRKNDKLFANGYGFGFNFGPAAGFAFQLLYKKLQYRTFQISGVKSTLPNDQFEVQNVDEVNLGFVIKF